MSDPIFRIVDGVAVEMPAAEADALRAEWAANAPAPDPVPELSRIAFCEALIAAGILTEADAESAALGNWPASFEPALAGKTFAQKIAAKRLWQSVKTVPKDAPLFLDLLDYYAGVSGLSGAQKTALADQIFAGVI